MRRRGTAEPPLFRDADALSRIQYTGGSTGLPKGAARTHGADLVGARRHHGLPMASATIPTTWAHPVPAGAPRRPQLVHHRVRGRGDAGHLRGVQRRADPPFHRVLPRDVHDLAAAYHVPAPSAVPHHRPVRPQLGAARAKRGRSHHEAHHPSHLRQVPQRGAQLRLGTVGKRRRQQPEDHARHAGGRFAPAGERGAADEARGDEGGGRGRQRGTRRRSGGRLCSGRGR